MYGIALHIPQKQDIAEDELQETFIKVYKHIDKFDESRGIFFTWMLNICRNGFKNIPIFDVSGRTIKSISTLNNSVDISDLTSGKYFIELKSSQYTYNSSFVK